LGTEIERKNVKEKKHKKKLLKNHWKENYSKFDSEFISEVRE